MAFKNTAVILKRRREKKTFLEATVEDEAPKMRVSAEIDSYYIYIYISLSLSIYLSLYLSIYLSIYLLQYLFILEKNEIDLPSQADG